MINPKFFKKLLLSIILFFIYTNNFNSQLNTFFDDWTPRSFNFPDYYLFKAEPSNLSDVIINFNTSNVLADILPSHFGTNLTHF